MFVAHGEQASRHGCRQRLTVAGRGQACGGARRRARAMIRHAGEDCIEQVPFALIGQTALM